MEVEINMFFRVVSERKVKDAEKILENIKNGLFESRRSKGYIKALEGLLLALKNENDKFQYLVKTFSSPDEVKSLKKEFEGHVKNELHDDYDIGYFEALRDYMASLELREKS